MNHLWVIKDEKAKAEYSSNALLELLLHQVQQKTDPPDQVALVETTFTLLQSKIYDMSFRLAFIFAFRLGYYYRLLLEKNNVIYTNDSN